MTDATSARKSDVELDWPVDTSGEPSLVKPADVQMLSVYTQFDGDGNTNNGISRAKDDLGVREHHRYGSVTAEDDNTALEADTAVSPPPSESPTVAASAERKQKQTKALETNDPNALSTLDAPTDAFAFSNKHADGDGTTHDSSAAMEQLDTLTASTDSKSHLLTNAATGRAMHTYVDESEDGLHHDDTNEQEPKQLADANIADTDGASADARIRQLEQELEQERRAVALAHRREQELQRELEELRSGKRHRRCQCCAVM